MASTNYHSNSVGGLWKIFPACAKALQVLGLMPLSAKAVLENYYCVQSECLLGTFYSLQLFLPGSTSLDSQLLARASVTLVCKRLHGVARSLGMARRLLVNVFTDHISIIRDSVTVQFWLAVNWARGSKYYCSPFLILRTLSMLISSNSWYCPWMPPLSSSLMIMFHHIESSTLMTHYSQCVMEHWFQ
jgi:hypothetical protein